MNNKGVQEKSIKQIILDFIQHNKRHYIKIDISGKTYYPCARCFGLWVGLIVGFILSYPFWFGPLRIHNFYLIFTIAWIFAMPTIIDWSTIKLGFRKGNNNIRMVTGYLYGLAVMIYLFILPANIIFKIVTYISYEGVFYAIRRKFQIGHYKIK